MIIRAGSSRSATVVPRVPGETSGPVVASLLLGDRLPDRADGDRAREAERFREMLVVRPDEEMLDMFVTTGGTGVSPRRR
jgi:molybdopterin biosynthesis enzyme MoaB